MKNLFPEAISQKAIPASSVANPNVGHFTIFYNSENDNKLSVKDSSGTVKEVTSSGSGIEGHEIYSQTGTTALPQQPALRFKGYLEATDDAVNSETEVDIASGSLAVANASRFDLNGSGDVDLKIVSNKLLTGDINGFATELTVTTDSILGLDTNSEVVEYEAVSYTHLTLPTKRIV